MDPLFDALFKYLKTGNATEENMRSAATLWKHFTTTAPAGREGFGSGSSPVPNASAGLQIEIGKVVVSEHERWKLQASMRREEVSKGGYNKKLMRPIKNTKGPTPGEAFPPGRCKPIRD